MVDQLIPMYTSIYGNEIVKTPNLDKLAAEGIKFENGYTTCPACVPTRHSLLTGMYLASHGAFDNGSILRSDIPTHNHYLNRAGYETCLAGKAHFVGPDQLHGFTRRLMTNIYPSAFKFMPTRSEKSHFQDLHPQPIAIDYVGENAGPTQEDMALDYDERAIFHGIRYLAEKRTNPGFSAQEDPPKRGKTPFFVQISLNKPHEPFLTYQEYWDMYEGVDIPIPDYSVDFEKMYTSMDKSLNKLHGVDKVDLRDKESLKRIYRAYYSLVTYIDDKLGEVLEAIDRYGLRENTIVIFLSDHGDMLGQRGMVQKRVFYEHSARIPLVINMPEKYQIGERGSVVTEPISITDVAPTILELAGITDYLPMDGKSLLPLMRGERDPDRYVFSENYSEGVLNSAVMVRKGDYKLTYIYHNDGEPEKQLFNVEKDPREIKNLAGKARYKKVESELENIILSNFDLEALDKQAQQNYERRKVIKESRKIANPPSWNYNPERGVDTLYWRD
jgi:choline-sulfatase